MITSSNEVGRSPKPIVSSDVEEYSPLLGEQHVVKNEVFRHFRDFDLILIQE